MSAFCMVTENFIGELTQLQSLLKLLIIVTQSQFD